VLLVPAGSVPGALSVVSGTLHGYYPETLTSMYATWWYGLQVTLSVVVMMFVALRATAAPLGTSSSSVTTYILC